MDITIGEETQNNMANRKEAPIWMMESTVITNTDSLDAKTSDSVLDSAAETSSGNKDDIMSVLLAHEKRPNTSAASAVRGS